MKTRTPMSVTFNLLSAFAIAIFSTPEPSHAGGFYLLEQSAEGVGFAFAGASAGYDDGSSIFFNPGAMTIQRKNTASLGGSFLDPNIEFSNDGSYTNPKTGGTALSGDNGPNGGVTTLLPNFYFVHPEGDLSFGFALNSPFGLSTRYSHTWVGRYHAIDTDLQTISLSPAIAFKVLDNLSIGAAMNIDYVSANLTNAVDFGTIGLSALGVERASALGLLPQMADGYAKVKGTDWGVGATVGASYQYMEGSRVGLAYHAPVDVTISGRTRFDVPSNAQILTSTGSFQKCDAEADLTIPESISAGIIQKVSDDWSVLGDVQLTRWSSFNELRVRYSSSQPDTVVDENWSDVVRLSTGAEYRPFQALKLRAGLTWDQEPVSDDEHRTPRIPGNDRYWLAFGASYDFTDYLRLDAAYAHLFVPGAKSNVASSTGDVLQGDWDLSIDIVSASMIYTF